MCACVCICVRLQLGICVLAHLFCTVVLCMCPFVRFQSQVFYFINFSGCEMWFWVSDSSLLSYTLVCLARTAAVWSLNKQNTQSKQKKNSAQLRRSKPKKSIMHTQLNDNKRQHGNGSKWEILRQQQADRVQARVHHTPYQWVRDGRITTSLLIIY